MRILPFPYLPLLRRTDISAMAKRKDAVLGLSVLRRGQNRPENLPVRLGDVVASILRFRPRGVCRGSGGERPGLGPSLFVGLLDPRFP